MSMTVRVIRLGTDPAESQKITVTNENPVHLGVMREDGQRIETTGSFNFERMGSIGVWQETGWVLSRINPMLLISAPGVYMVRRVGKFEVPTGVYMDGAGGGLFDAA